MTTIRDEIKRLIEPIESNKKLIPVVNAEILLSFTLLLCVRAKQLFDNKNFKVEGLDAELTGDFYTDLLAMLMGANFSTNSMLTVQTTGFLAWWLNQDPEELEKKLKLPEGTDWMSARGVIEAWNRYVKEEIK